MAGSRYRKTARAHSTQKKNIEIPLIYPRLWLQSKPVKKKKKKRQRGVGGRPKQTTMSGLPVPEMNVLAITICRVLVHDLAVQLMRCLLAAVLHLAGVAEVELAHGQSCAHQRCCQHPPPPAENPLLPPQGLTFLKTLAVSVFSLLASHVHIKQISLPLRSACSHKCI